MINEISTAIENLKFHTQSSLTNIQNSKVPYHYKLETERMFSYDEHGFYHSVYRSDCLLLLTMNLPFSINLKRHTFCDDIETLIKNQEMLPFLLFLNDRFIKWSDIKIIKDCKYSYMMIDGYNEKNPEVKCIMLPNNIKYKENCDNIEDAVFSFNIYGEFTDESLNNKPFTNIYIESHKDIYYEGGRVKTFRQHINLPSEDKVCLSNIFVFNEGLLDTNISLKGLNVFSIDDRKPIELANKMIYRTFYYRNTNKSVDLINNIKDQNKSIEELTTEKKIPKHLIDLNKTFDFEFTNQKSYSNNIADTLDYVMSYNSALMNDVYKDKSNIITKTYTGSHIKKLADKFGIVKMSRKISEDLSCNVVIFHNGLLYDGYNRLRYINKDFTFPIKNVNDNDVFEFLFFKNIDNREWSIVCHSGCSDNIHTLDSTIDLENARMFTLDIRDKEFSIERKDSIQYEVDFKFERISKNKVKITPVDNFYYDRTLNLVSSRQFKYACQICQEDMIDFTLPYEFRFCNNLNKFMVFVNGKRLDKENFKITIIKPTRPFDDITAFVNIPASKGQKIEVLYVPDAMEEVACINNLDNTGRIILDKSKISYNLSKELYLIFINGRKMNNSDMIDIRNNALLINSTSGIQNITILKHINDNEILVNLFKEKDDLLANILSKIEPSKLTELYNAVRIENTEDNCKDNQVPMKAVMYEILKKYWMRPYINTGDSFVYDFDNDGYFDEKDSSGTTIVRTQDATVCDKLGIQ